MKALRLSLLAAVLFVAACSSKLTPENYEKITPGMSRTEVHALLGKPDEVNAKELGGVLALSKETWKSGKKRLTVTFGNDSVALKSFDTAEPEAPEKN